MWTEGVHERRGTIVRSEVEPKFACTNHINILLLDRCQVVAVARSQWTQHRQARVLEVDGFRRRFDRCDELGANWGHHLERFGHGIGSDFEFFATSGRGILMRHAGRFCHSVGMWDTHSKIAFARFHNWAF